MAVTAKTKKKISAATKSAPKIDLEGTAARKRELEAVIEKANKKAALATFEASEELSQINKTLLEHANETLTADQELEIKVPGAKSVKVGRQGTSRTVTDMAKAKALMGDKTFMAVAKINLADIDKYLTPEQIAKCVKTERTQTRRIT